MGKSEESKWIAIKMRIVRDGAVMLRRNLCYVVVRGMKCFDLLLVGKLGI